MSNLVVKILTVITINDCNEQNWPVPSLFILTINLDHNCALGTVFECQIFALFAKTPFLPKKASHFVYTPKSDTIVYAKLDPLKKIGNSVGKFQRKFLLPDLFLMTAVTK